MAIKVVQLRDLRNIVADVTENQDGTTNLKDPLAIYVFNQPGSDTPGLDFIPAFPFAKADLKVMVYPTVNIVHSYEPQSDILKGYKIKTTGLVAAPEKSLILPN